MEKIVTYIALFLFIFSIGPGQGMATVEDEPSQEVVRAAENGLTAFVKNPEISNLDRLGFISVNGQAARDDAIIGKGFRIYTVPPQKILDEKEEVDLYSEAVPQTQWQFLIETQGKAVSLMTIDRMGDQWEAVSIGSAGLADQLKQLLQAWPPSDGYDHRLIRIYQAKSDFLAISKDNKVLGIIPMTSGRIAMNLEGGAFNTGDLRSSEEIVESIREAVMENMQSK